MEWQRTKPARNRWLCSCSNVPPREKSHLYHCMYICVYICVHTTVCMCLHVCDKVCVFLNFDDSACYEATVMSVNSVECLAAAQCCCSHGRHMVCEQHIWDWDRQGLACSCTIDNMPSSTICTSLFIISLLSWSSNCICNNTYGHGL